MRSDFFTTHLSYLSVFIIAFVRLGFVYNIILVS